MSAKLARAADAVGERTDRGSGQPSVRSAEREVDFIPATREAGRAPAHVGLDDRTVDDSDTIRRPMQSPPDPSFGRPLRGTQND